MLIAVKETEAPQLAFLDSMTLSPTLQQLQQLSRGQDPADPLPDQKLG